MTDFKLAVECEIRVRFRRAFERGASFVDIVSGEVHRTVGGYPGRSHRMPMVCKAMRNLRLPRETAPRFRSMARKIGVGT